MSLFADAPVIHRYTRAQGIADGVLVDVTDTAREAGFKYPVAMTAAAYADTVTWTDADEDRKAQFTGQDEAGRLWDVLYMAMVAARRPQGRPDMVTYQFYRVPREGRAVKARLVTLVARIGPGDTAAPVITITLPSED